MKRPRVLSVAEPLPWSPGLGTDVWEMFRACIEGSLDAVQRLLRKDPSLVRCSHAYRTPLYFAVRENRGAIVEHLLREGADPLSFAVNDTLLDIARDRGYLDLERVLEAALATRFGASPRGEPVAWRRQHDLSLVDDL